MNEITALIEHGPQAPPLRPAVEAAARARLVAEIQAGRRVRRLSPRRVAAVVVAAVAACVAAVFALAPTPPRIDLVGFAMPTFPLTFTGHAATSFGMDPGGRLSALVDGFDVAVRSDPERALVDERVEPVIVAGRPAELATGRIEWADGTQSPRAVVRWQPPGGGWITVGGTGPAADPVRLRALVATVTEQPQEIPLQLRLAPAGWSVHAFKDRVLTLADDSDPSRTLTLSTPSPGDVEGPVEGAAGPAQQVTVQGHPAELVPTQDGWRLRGTFADGTPLLLQVPAPFTAADAVAVGDAATHRP